MLGQRPKVEPEPPFTFDAVAIQSPLYREQFLLTRYLLCRERLPKMSLDELREHRDVYARCAHSHSRYDPANYFGFAVLAHHLFKRHARDADLMVKLLLSCNHGLDLQQSYRRDLPALKVVLKMISDRPMQAAIIRRKIWRAVHSDETNQTLAQAVASLIRD